MSRHARSIAVWLCLFIAGPLAAADISVPPGTGTLAAAIASATDGDTLILSDGGFFGDAVVDRSLTIRPVNRYTDAVIGGTVTVQGEGITVTIQGIKFSQNLVLDQAASIRLLENTWNAGNIIADTYRTSDGDGALVIVGNQLVSGRIGTVSSDNAYIAGNQLLDGSILTNSSVWIVGNDVTEAGYQFGIYAQGGAATVRILGNRVSCMYYASIDCLYSNASSSLIAGNIVQVQDATNVYTFPQHGISTGGTNFATVVNNVVRGTPETATRSGAAISISSDGARVYGNIVIDYDSDNHGAIYVSAPTAEVTYNLCYNNTSACPAGEGNLDADPRFVDLVDFKLAADSPAIDAGLPDYASADLDRTRNDMGAYGGPWSIGQYDAQRDPYSLAPYVYPLLKADSAYADGVLEIQALGVAKLR